jgi:hypothetical protein
MVHRRGFHSQAQVSEFGCGTLSLVTHWLYQYWKSGGREEGLPRRSLTVSPGGACGLIVGKRLRWCLERRKGFEISRRGRISYLVSFAACSCTLF